MALRKLRDIKKLSAAIADLRGRSGPSLGLQKASGFDEEDSDEGMQTASSDSSNDSPFFNRQAQGSVSVPSRAPPSSKLVKQTVEQTVISPGGRAHMFSTQEEWIRCVESPDSQFKSLLKLAISFFYCSFALWVTAFVMVIVHDRVPGERVSFRGHPRRHEDLPALAGPGARQPAPDSLGLRAVRGDRPGARQHVRAHRRLPQAQVSRRPAPTSCPGS